MSTTSGEYSTQLTFIQAFAPVLLRDLSHDTAVACTCCMKALPIQYLAASSNEAAAAQQLANAARQHSTGPGSPAAARDVVEGVAAQHSSSSR
eukprot:4940136-Prymnesium_polylepis.1